MEDGTLGRLRNANVRVALLPMQFPALTTRLPETQLPLKLSWMVLLPAPLTIEELAGTVQLYILVLATTGVEKVCVVLIQVVVGPLITVGLAGTAVIRDTAKQVGKLVPQELFAVIQIFPPEKVAPKLTTILVVLEDPVTPVGNVQL